MRVILRVPRQGTQAEYMQDAKAGKPAYLTCNAGMMPRWPMQLASGNTQDSHSTIQYAVALGGQQEPICCDTTVYMVDP